MGCHTWFFRPINKDDNIHPANIEIYKGVEYIDKDTEHDLFRIFDYPNIHLLSLNQTLKFIEQNKNKMSFSDHWEQSLIDFWCNNPNGLIRFG